jgi:hypothetical protein|nr:hypothetical protein [Kofleriaceae bacterium]
MPPATDNRAYKRSWKNLLINKRYQLQFTLFMVGLSTLLMIGLGIWVMKEANEATNVSLSSELGTNCGTIEVIDDTAPAVAAPAAPAQEPAVPMATDGSAAPAPSPAPAAGSAGSAAGSAGSAAGSGDVVTEHHVKVQIEESEMVPVAPPPPPPPKLRNDLLQQIADHWQCKLVTSTNIDKLHAGRDRILWVMILTGLLLVLGLAGFGIKMTHKVAGPLFKITLYLGKMRDGRLDKVYNLRKGDQLVEFYDHFKSAHAGVVANEKADIAAIKKVIESAEAAGLGARPAVAELRAMLARKEKSLE